MRTLRKSLSAILIASTAAIALLPSSASAQCFTQVNDDGWGDMANLYAWSQAVFNDQLYVGTFSPDIGARIFRYDGANWETVVTNGLTSPNNTGVRNLIVFNGQLYAGTFNADDGGEVWRTSDGDNWETVVSGGFGNPLNTGVRAMRIFANRLLIGVQADDAVGQLYSTQDGENYSPLILFGLGGANTSIHALEEFNGWLYLGTKNSSSGLQVWRSLNGRNWDNVVGPLADTVSGFGFAKNNVVFDLHTYDGHLYVGSGNWPFGFTMFRSADGINYTQVGQQGFGEVDNAYGWRFHTYNDQLWFGVMNRDIFNKGASLFRSTDGLTWEKLVGGGGTFFGYGFNNGKNWGIRSFAEFNGDLYIGTAQCWVEFCRPFMIGAEVWKYTEAACPAS